MTFLHQIQHLQTPACLLVVGLFDTSADVPEIADGLRKCRTAAANCKQLDDNKQTDTLQALLGSPSPSLLGSCRQLSLCSFVRLRSLSIHFNK
ncbi:Prosaposin [Trichinella spiralis]|uniref:Prosaposin n=1 Tax=Trichinella spiralis TaxID=6334 RepID=A0ABR3K3Z9_TRISP